MARSSPSYFRCWNSQSTESAHKLAEQHRSVLFADRVAIIALICVRIIGVQPPVRELAAQETQQRFNYLLTHFLCSFASQSKPLVIVFDDIQWADRFSLEAIEALVSNSACHDTLILIASRLQGDTREAQLSAMLHRMKDTKSQAVEQNGSVMPIAGSAVQTVSMLLLQPLQLDSITSLVSDTLCCSLFKSLALASFLLSQTGGSPLFVSQIMQALHRDGLLHFTFETAPEEEAVAARETYRKDKGDDPVHPLRYHREWTYNLAEIQKYFGVHTLVHGQQQIPAVVGLDGVLIPAVSGSVTDGAPVGSSSMLLFLQRHVAQLSAASRLVLKYASCLGFEFSLLLLCQLLNDRQLHYSASDIRAALAQPMKEELIVFVQTADAALELSKMSNQANVAASAVEDEPPADADDEEGSHAHGEESDHVGSRSGASTGASGHRAGYSGPDGGEDVNDASMYNHTLQTRGTAMGVTGAGALPDVMDFSSISDSESYAFLHDKLHEAIYAAISEAERAEIHLRIAQIMLQQHDDAFEQANLRTLALLTQQQGKLPGVAVVVIEPEAAVKGGPSAAASAAHMSEHHYFAIANHYLKCLSLLSSSPKLCKRAASFLLVASTSAKQVGAYLTALDFVKAAMLLMKLQEPQVGPAQGLGEMHSGDTHSQPADKEEVTSSMSESAAPSSQELPRDRTAAEQLHTKGEMDHVWSVTSDYDLLFALSFARGELEYLCGHHQSSAQHFKACLNRTQKLTQQIAIYRQLIRLKTIAGEYQAALRLSVEGLQLLGVEVHGLSTSGKKVYVDSLAVHGMFDQLQQLLQRFESINEQEEEARVAAIASSTHAKAAANLLNPEAAGAAISSSAALPVSDDSEDSDGSDDASSDENDGGGGGEDQTSDDDDNGNNLARITIRSLLHHLPPCSDTHQVLVGDLLLESVFPAYMLNAHVLQHVALSSVIHSIKHGLSGNEGFSFAMVGASLLATRIDDTRLVAVDAQEWGKLGLALCLKFNNQTDYCRTLMANALFINSFTGHLERSILELHQAIYIGSLVGDQQFVAQSSLAVVMLQQYTSSLGEWEEMLTQAQFDNQKLLQDYAVNKYTIGMKLILPTLMTPHAPQPQHASSLASGTGMQTPLYESDLGAAHVSRAEQLFIDELLLEAGSESSLHLTLYAITKAKTQLCFHRPELAVQTLKLADIHRVAGQPELITFLLVQSLTYLALIRVDTEIQAKRNALAKTVARATVQQAASAARAESVAGRPGVTGVTVAGAAHVAAVAAAKQATVTATQIAQTASDLLYLTYWRQVQMNQVQLCRFAVWNQRDFHCQYLLVRAEMAYTALYAYDQGIILEAGDQLSEDLLAPEVARAKQAHNKGQRRKKKVGEAVDENQLSGMMNAKAKKDRVANQDKKRALRKERHANARLSEEPSSIRVPQTIKQSKKIAEVQTILTSDPLLRDQLVSRIAAVYSTAAAMAVSSRCNYGEVSGDQREGANEEAETGNGSGGPNNHRSKPESVASTGARPADNNNPYNTLGRMVPNAGETSTLAAHRYRSSSSALRCNDFIEGLSNELSCRFHFYVKRPQQAMNFLLISMRSYGRWGALAVTASLQQEFAEQFADVISVLTGATGAAQAGGGVSGLDKSLASFPTLGQYHQSTVPILRQRVPIGSTPQPQHRMLHASSRARAGLNPVVNRLPVVPGGIPPILHGTAQALSLTHDLQDSTVHPLLSTASTGTLGGATTLTFTADFEIGEFNYPTSGQLGTRSIAQANAVVPIVPTYHPDATVTSEGSVMGGGEPGDAPERVQDLDLQSIIKAIQTISRELVLPNLISKLMKIILHNAGAQRATLLSRQQQPANGDTSTVPELSVDDEVEWRIDAMIEFDRAAIYLNPQYAVSNGTTSCTSSPEAGRRELAQTSTSVGSVSSESSVHTAGSELHSLGVGSLEMTAVASTTSSDYPRSILNFVLHSQKSVILADASSDKVFGNDPCIRSKRTKSILCLPLILRNSLISVLYLEHPTVPAAFTRDRLLSCRLITQQAAISMETARLYATMEAQVASRTAELRRATQDAKEANQAKSTFLAVSEQSSTSSLE